MFYLSFNLKFQVRSKFLTCFDECDVIKIPLFNSNIEAAKNETYEYLWFVPSRSRHG